MSRYMRGAMAALLWLGISLAAHAQTTVEYIHTDALGTPIAVTDANKVVIETTEYEPYGAQVAGPVKDGPGYTGHVQDAATGLTYMQQRYFDPQVGLFLSVDPVTAYSNPVGMFNRYRYANNNPYRFFDPDGRQSADHDSRSICNTRKCDAVIEGSELESTAIGVGGSSSTVPQAPYPNEEMNRNPLNPKAANLGDKASRLAENVLDEVLNRLLPAIPGEGQVYAGGVGLLVKFQVVAKFNPAREAHIFRVAENHVAPATAASRARFAALFEAVASNPNNFRPDAVKAKLITEHAAEYGVQSFTQTMSNGKQVWVNVRNGEIVNAGVNAAGAAR